MKTNNKKTAAIQQQDKLDAYLKANRLRKTAERDAILHVATDLRGPFTAQQLLQRVIDSVAGGISRSTLYQTLRLLEQAGIIQRIQLGQPQTLYELKTSQPQCHLVCTSCGRVKTVTDKHLDAFMLTRRYPAFNPITYSLTVTGTCSTCSRRARRDNTV